MNDLELRLRLSSLELVLEHSKTAELAIALMRKEIDEWIAKLRMEEAARQICREPIPFVDAARRAELKRQRSTFWQKPNGGE